MDDDIIRMYVDQIFDTYDNDRNGFFDVMELHTFMNQMYANLKDNRRFTQAEMKSLFNQLDVYKDGRIHKPELFLMIKKLWQNPGMSPLEYHGSHPQQQQYQQPGQYGPPGYGYNPNQSNLNLQNNRLKSHLLFLLCFQQKQKGYLYFTKRNKFDQLITVGQSGERLEVCFVYFFPLFVGLPYDSIDFILAPPQVKTIESLNSSLSLIRYDSYGQINLRCDFLWKILIETITELLNFKPDFLFHSFEFQLVFFPQLLQILIYSLLAFFFVSLKDCFAEHMLQTHRYFEYSRFDQGQQCVLIIVHVFFFLLRPATFELLSLWLFYLLHVSLVEIVLVFDVGISGSIRKVTLAAFTSEIPAFRIFAFAPSIGLLGLARVTHKYIIRVTYKKATNKPQTIRF